MTDLSTIDVIAPNFKRRHSGVTSTVIRLVPLQAKQIAITSCAPDLPPEVPNVAWTKLLGMTRNGLSGPRVWHARRNVEMVAGLALKYALFKNMRLLFTSAAQRRHKPFTRWLIRQQDAIIATSSKSAAYLERPAEVIRHGVDCAQFSPAEDKAALRRALDLPSGTLIGCFGRIRHQKGNDLFVDAMLRVLPDHPDAHALIMGRATANNQDYLDDLKAKVTAAGLEGQIHFRDEVPIDTLADHFRALDLYIAPQRWEGFGLTPLEAMACCAPVIATRVGAFEELVVDGETGNLVEIEDVDAMASHTQALLSDPEKMLQWGQAARAHVLANFQLQQEADAIVAIYRQLLGS
ncbi:glycosyltransferase family 4 protein [uncultured Tateyamaria sp.]|uniref:glycosyltransferase family 4 protein n=1 Tax=uncultured Tateyamaria sp. TaxID=455651 RepID=UPI0026071271|nr:glycosyltransferase family 4 protein [uncultured Tateyamaria sp.]